MKFGETDGPTVICLLGIEPTVTLDRVDHPKDYCRLHFCDNEEDPGHAPPCAFPKKTLTASLYLSENDPRMVLAGTGQDQA